MEPSKTYDIFISYSRKDLDQVSAFVDILKQCIPTIDIWMDLKGIEAADEFDEEIIKAIDSSSYVIFAMSSNSNSVGEDSSKWTKKELVYAKNTGKRVIPILLPGAELSSWFLFEFGRVDCIDITDDVQVEKLLANLATWTGKAQAQQPPQDQPPIMTQEKQALRDEAERINKIYKNNKRNVSVILSLLFSFIAVAVAIPMAVIGYKNRVAGWQYTILRDSIVAPRTVEITRCDRSSKVVYIPSKIKRMKVVSIAPGAFQGCTQIQHIDIPANVTHIGAEAFAGCTALESVDISNGVVSIGDGAFADCKQLKQVVIPSSVSRIGKYVFYKCSSLQSISVERDNVLLDSRDSCNAIIESSTHTLVAACNQTVIPPTVKHIGDYAFAGTSFQRYYLIPDSVESIGYRAFMETYLESFIRLPRSLKYIGSEAFIYSDSPKEILYAGTQQHWQSIHKEPDWHKKSLLKVVHCLDATTQLEYQP
jgi:hypothetical protein